MCLSTVDLDMQWNKHQKTFVGIGYKLMYVDEANVYKNWQEAQGKMSRINARKGSIRQSRLHSSDGREYHPGFHIFLTQEDAAAYSSEKYKKCVVQVKFKGILAFGTNNTKIGLRPCVIAQFMKLDKIVEIF